MTHLASRLFENQKLKHVWYVTDGAQSVCEPAHDLPGCCEKKLDNSHVYGTFLWFLGNNVRREVRLVAAGEK